jgi:hypothetical protein
MPESLGAMQVCDAAAKGDVQTLRLLVECAGIQVLYKLRSNLSFIKIWTAIRFLSIFYFSSKFRHDL